MKKKIFEYVENQKVSKIIIILCFVVFVLQALFFALTIKESLPPDEAYHLKLSQVYSKTLSRPSNSEETYYIGQIEDTAFLYHWISGRIINLKDAFFPALSDLVTLRIVSVLTGVSSIFIAYQIIKLLTEDKLAQTLLVIMLTNTLMFVFISGGVSYDPLTTLFSLLIIYFVLKLFKHKTIENMFFFLFFLLLGALTKITLPPFAFIVILFLVIHEWKYRGKYLESLKEFWKRKKVLTILLALVILILVVLNTNLYIANFIKYKNMIPECTQVMEFDDCMKSAEYSFHHGLVESAPPRNERVTIYWYFHHWVYYQIESLYGVLAHTSMILPHKGVLCFYGIFIISITLFIRNFDFKSSEQKFLSFLIVSYLFVLFFFLNYSTYIDQGILQSGIQGRYLFPILVPIYVLIASNLSYIRRSYLKVGLFLLFSSIFIYWNIPFFLSNVTNEWFLTESWILDILH